LKLTLYTIQRRYSKNNILDLEELVLGNTGVKPFDEIFKLIYEEVNKVRSLLLFLDLSAFWKFFLRQVLYFYFALTVFLGDEK